MDQDELNWLKNKRKNIVIIHTVPLIFCFKTLRGRKGNHSSQMQNDAAMHPEGLKGLKHFLPLTWLIFITLSTTTVAVNPFYYQIK